MKRIPAANFCDTLFSNVNNEKLSDSEFRELVRNTMKIVETKNTVNLNECVPGQKLRTKHGTILVYVGRLEGSSIYNHKIQYPNGSFGTRTNDGFTYRNPDKRLPLDEDIIEILPL